MAIVQIALAKVFLGVIKFVNYSYWNTFLMSDNQYQPQIIEKQVQEYWAKNKVFAAVEDPNKEKAEALEN